MGPTFEVTMKTSARSFSRPQPRRRYGHARGRPDGTADCAETIQSGPLGAIQQGGPVGRTATDPASRSQPGTSAAQPGPYLVWLAQTLVHPTGHVESAPIGACKKGLDDPSEKCCASRRSRATAACLGLVTICVRVRGIVSTGA